MQRIYLLTIIMMLKLSASQAQCAEGNVERVMLIGDSWAAMMHTDSTFKTVSKLWGHSDKTFYTNAILAENGTQTTDFLQPAKLTEIQNQLLAHPTIDFVHLSLGGNDVLAQWNKNWSQAKTDSLLDSVSVRLNIIMDFIKFVKPGIKIVWSGYAYPNFGEIIGDLAPFQASHPFYGMWNGMGQPTFLELNTILNYYSATMEAQASSDPQLEFIKAAGVMQYTFGQPTNLPLSPGGSYPAFTAPLPLGFPDYPSPKNSMRNYVIFRDCFHLSTQGFSDFISYQFLKYYQKALMHDQYIISDGGTRDGSVSAQGTVSSSLILGSSLNEDYTMVLSFNTSLMPDTGVAAAALFLRREMVTGANPISSSMNLNVVNGNFGASIDVEVSDFGDPGNATGMPCQFGTGSSDGGWIRLEIPATLLPFINHTNTTQFTISVPSASGAVFFTDASDPELGPVLDITYGPQFTGVNEIEILSNQLYPNPTNGILHLKSENTNVSSYEVYDLPGRLLQGAIINDSNINISNLPTGVYLIKLINSKGIQSIQRVVKK